MAQKIVEATPDFFKTIGEGAGNIRANTFMARLKLEARKSFGCDYSEAKVCRDNKFSLDFYFPDEETVVEIAGMLATPNSEYEKDIFKCLLAQERGARIRQLVFIAKLGASRVQKQAGRSAIAQFVLKKFGRQIKIEELVDPALA